MAEPNVIYKRQVKREKFLPLVFQLKDFEALYAILEKYKLKWITDLGNCKILNKDGLKELGEIRIANLELMVGDGSLLLWLGSVGNKCVVFENVPENYLSAYWAICDLLKGLKR